MGFESKLLGIKSDVVETTLANLGSAVVTIGAKLYLTDQNKVVIFDGEKWGGGWVPRKFNVGGRGMLATSGSSGFTATSAAYTLMNEVEFDVEFDWVRFHLVNGNSSL